jgi:CRP-like cAMP-binding protein
MTHDLHGAVRADDLAVNRLLAALPDEEVETIRANAKLVTMNRRDVMFESGKPIEHVYFLIDGIASLVSVMADGTGVETATVGREGMVGLPIFHGVSTTAEQALVQVAVKAYRIDAGKFAELLPELPELTRLLHRFSVVMFTLAAQNSGCNRKHSIEERCCRWLLMVADRLDRTSFDLTHDFVAQMLGVRRASVTETLGSLEKRGILQTGRGRISIVNRSGLEESACECYGVIRETVERLLDHRTTTPSPLAGVVASSNGRSIVRAPFG